MKHCGPTRPARRALWLLLPIAVGLLTSTADATGSGHRAEVEQLLAAEWFQSDLPGIGILSGLDPRTTREAAAALGNFRRAALLVRGDLSAVPALPARVILLPRASEVLGIRGGIHAYLQVRMRTATIVVAPGPMFAEALRHEFAHYLMHGLEPHRYPAWYDEGMAGYLATLTVDGEEVTAGGESPARVRTLYTHPWMPWAEIVAAATPFEFAGAQLDLFYAQSWLLVHHLSDALGMAELRRRLLLFQAHREAGLGDVPAFERAFGMPVDSLDAPLRKHLRRLPRRTFRLPEGTEPEFVDLRPASTAATAAALGQLAQARDARELARTFFEVALERDPEQPQALAGMGQLEAGAGRYLEAESWYVRARDLAPDSGWIELDYGNYLMMRALLFQTSGRSAAATASFAEALRHLERSVALDPGNPEALAMLGLCRLLAGGDPAEAARSLEAAHALLPSHPDIRFLLARALAASGREDAARAQVRTLRAWSRGPQPRGLGDLLAVLDTDTADRGPESVNTSPGETP